MYYSQSEIINFKLLADKARVDSDMLKDLIEADKQSKLKLSMVKGEKYYMGEHDYLQHKNLYYDSNGNSVEIKTRANNLIPVQFFTLSADQKKEYLLGKPPTISIEEPWVEDETAPTKEEKIAIAQAEKFQTDLTKQLGKKFNNILGDSVLGATKKALEWIHFYIDPDGSFQYVITPAQQIIPIYDVQYENKLIEIIRYYEYTLINTQSKSRVQRYKVERWTSTEVTYYEQGENGGFSLDLYYETNPYPHWMDVNKALAKTVKNNWGRPPFVPVFNNSQGTNDLQPIKELMDAYDKVISGWANDLEDIKQLILILKGYNQLSEATKKGLSELEYFLQTLHTYGAIPIDNDGSVTNLSNDIPVDARERFLKICRDAIFEIGRMVDSTKMMQGDVTNVAIKSHYAGLDMKCNAMIAELQESLVDIMWFIVTWMNKKNNTKYDYNQIDFTFNKSQIFNEAEFTTSLVTVADRISEKTFLENLPFVDDVDEEIARLEADRERKNSTNMANLDNVPDENYYDKDGRVITDKNYTGELYDAAGNEVRESRNITTA